MASDNTGQKQANRFQKGVSGNPNGRPKGSRNSATLATEAMLDGEAEALLREAIDMALAGDTVALKLCLEEFTRRAEIARDVRAAADHQRSRCR